VAIAAALATGRDEDWLVLWEAVDALAEETTFATWAGGDVVQTTIVDGEKRHVFQMPYPRYAERVSRVEAQLGALRLFAPFDWPGWTACTATEETPSRWPTRPSATPCACSPQSTAQGGSATAASWRSQERPHAGRARPAPRLVRPRAHGGPSALSG
jgi:hypothetical protein